MVRQIATKLEFKLTYTLYDCKKICDEIRNYMLKDGARILAADAVAKNDYNWHPLSEKL